MANEIAWRHSATGKTVYATIRSAARTYWYTVTPALETLTVAHWADYDIALAEAPASSYFYVGTWPATLTTVGWYWLDIYEQAGAGPAIGDTLIGGIVGYWNGTALLPWAADTTQVAGTAQTAGDIVGNLGTPSNFGSGATVAANLVDIEGQTDDIGVAGAGLTAIPVVASVAISTTEAENVASGRLAIRSYYSFSQVIESTSTAALNTATKLWLAIKANEDDLDSAALVLIEKTAGLTVLAGAAYTSTTHGSLAVAGSAGAWEIPAALDEVVTGLLHSYATSGLYAEVKALVGTATIPVWDGHAAISKGIVRSVS